MTGADLKLSGTRADFDTSPTRRRPADRVDGVHRQGRGQVPGDHARRMAARQDPQPAAALRDRARPRDPHLAADRLHGGIAVGWHRRRSRADHRARVVRRGEGHRDRPPDRRAPGQVRHARRDRPSRPRSARTRSRRRRSPRSSASSWRWRCSCSSSTASSASSRCSACSSTRRSSTRRCSSSTSPDAAGDRRPRAHARRGGGRERRHLRTHQGRGASRAQRAARDLDRLHEGLRHHRRRQRGDHDHRARALRRGDGERARLRADAPRRHRHLDAHRRARDARLPHGAGRLQGARQHAPDRDLRPRRSRPGCRIDYIGRRQLWFAISRVAIGPDRRSARSRSRASTSASTSRAAHRSRSRRRSPSPLEDVRAQAAEIGQSKVPSSRGAAGRHGRRFLPELPDPHGDAARRPSRPAARGRARGGSWTRAFENAQNVSESFGRQIAKSAIVAIIVSLAPDRRYVSLRFQWKFAVPVLRHPRPRRAHHDRHLCAARAAR